MDKASKDMWKDCYKLFHRNQIIMGKIFRKSEMNMHWVTIRVIALIIIIVGLNSSCSKETTMEYGNPSGKFIVRGKVTSSIDNTSIKGIQVILDKDTTYTDDSGNYEVSRLSFPYAVSSHKVFYKDIDGELNGAFHNKEISVDFVDPVFVNGDGMYSGEVAKVNNVKLEHK
jgi:putative lipoprotein (rSAM/lipoprotein system)